MFVGPMSYLFDASPEPWSLEGYGDLSLLQAKGLPRPRGTSALRARGQVFGELGNWIEIQPSSQNGGSNGLTPKDMEMLQISSSTPTG